MSLQEPGSMRALQLNTLLRAMGIVLAVTIGVLLFWLFPLKLLSRVAARYGHSSPCPASLSWLVDNPLRRRYMLPVLDREGAFTARQTVIHSLALLVTSLAAGAAGLGGPWYLGGAFVLGVGLTLFSLRLVSTRDLAAARGLFLASVLYLPALCTLLLAARF